MAEYGVGVVLGRIVAAVPLRRLIGCGRLGRFDRAGLALQDGQRSRSNALQRNQEKQDYRNKIPDIGHDLIVEQGHESSNGCLR